MPNICDKCGAIFATAFEVESHLLVHIESAMSDNIIETVYSCEECGNTFLSLEM